MTEFINVNDMAENMGKTVKINDIPIVNKISTIASDNMTSGQATYRNPSIGVSRGSSRGSANVPFNGFSRGSTGGSANVQTNVQTNVPTNVQTNVPIEEPYNEPTNVPQRNYQLGSSLVPPKRMKGILKHTEVVKDTPAITESVPDNAIRASGEYCYSFLGLQISKTTLYVAIFLLVLLIGYYVYTKWISSSPSKKKKKRTPEVTYNEQNKEDKNEDTD